MDLEKLDSAINELELNSKQLKNFTAVYSDISALQSNISRNMDLIEENNKTLNSISNFIKKQTEDNKKQLKIANDFLDQKIGEIYKDSKAFQKELDATIITRLDKHKSDIQIEIRTEGTQIQRAIDTALQSSFYEMESKFKERFEIQSKELITLKSLVYVLIVIGVGLGIGLYLK
jgi:type II secretory ATPase GspE/PulE/Tfp pilus assembly ATPase PilB-like protein